MKRVIVDYESSLKQSFILAQKVKSLFVPDVIVTVPEGGLLVATEIASFFSVPVKKIIIKRNLNLSFFYSFFSPQVHFLIRTIHRLLFKLVYPKYISLDSFDYSNKNILIVDDATETGKTLFLAKKILKKHSLNIVKTAVLSYVKGESPDFFLNNSVVMYPWSKDSKDYLKFKQYISQLHS